MKYIHKKWIDTRTKLRMEVKNYVIKEKKQTQYWVCFYRPKGKKILKRELYAESTLTRLMPYLTEIKD